MFTPDNLPEYLTSREVELIFFGGKGGVGKTTTAVASALYWAVNNPQDKILLVSTDPAHSVRDSLADNFTLDNLEVVELDAAAALAAFKAENAEKLREIARRGTFLEDDDINRFLELSLPGLDELMAFLEITRWTQSGDYSRIFVDTAPTGHTLRLLEMPVLLEKWLKVLDALLAKRRYMIQLYRQSYQADEIDRFLLDLNERIKTLETLLIDESRCRFVPVCLSEAVVIEETAELLASLQEKNIPVRDIMVQRVVPENECAVCQEKRARQQVQLDLLPPIFDPYTLRYINLQPLEMRGANLLNSTAASVENQTEEIPLISLRAESSDATFQIFAGKGGVGKTTLACATALNLAREFPRKKVLLFSTDPAHSVADCLNVELNDEPTSIKPNLTALQVDAAREFDALKNLYAEEVKNLLDGLMPNLDLTFDAEVMERLMDLSPPGIDEAMALTKVLEMHQRREFDILVLDSAPTGHLLRLLEMPALLDSWLKSVFHLLIKYKDIFRVPRLSQKLVEISQSLKHLRKLWSDAERTNLFAVSILTEMSLAETADLTASCERLGVAVKGIFLNQATRPSDCDLCRAVYQREMTVARKFVEDFDAIPQTLIYHRPAVQGVNALEKLGAKIYEAEYVETAI